MRAGRSARLRPRNPSGSEAWSRGGSSPGSIAKSAGVGSGTARRAIREIRRASVSSISSPRAVVRANGSQNAQREAGAAARQAASSRSASRENQLHGHDLAHELVGLDHADRVLETIEPRDLDQQGAVRVEAELRADALELCSFEVAVLLAQRIDARHDEELRMGEGLRELLHRVDARVVSLDEGLQSLPNVARRVADIDVCAPDPFPFPVAAEREKRRGLGIMDDHDLRLFEDRPQALEVARVHLSPQLPFLVADMDRASLESVVERFRDREETSVSPDHFPAGVDPEIAHQGDHPLEDLRDAPALACRVHMDDPDPGELLPEPAQLRDHGGPDDRLVGGKGLVHDCAPAVARTSTNFCRSSESE